MKKKGLIFIIIPIVVVIFGLIGYCGYRGYTFYEGLIASFKFLRVDLSGVTRNVFMEIARCLGIIFYFSLLYAVAYALFDAIRLFFRVRRKGAIAIHGDSSMAKYCAENIRGGKSCVLSDSKASFKAKKQIVWFGDDTKSLNFYEANKALMAKDEVYIALNSIPVDGTIEENVHLFNVNENIAVTYWEKNFVTEPEKIVLIGSGALAEQMLEHGLMMNVYAMNGGVNYHVIGDFDLYQAMHPHLQEAVGLTQDQLTFSKDPWHTQIDAILAADRIILADNDQKNVDVASQLMNYGLRTQLHLRAESDEAKVLFQADNVSVFGTLKELLGAEGENLFQDRIHQAGRTLDAAYGKLSGNVNDDNADDGNIDVDNGNVGNGNDNARWASLPGFLKRSNYAVAQHAVVKKTILRQRLEERGISYEDVMRDGAESMRAFWNDPANKDLVEELQEIEHLRWWRLYLLNNFTYNEDVKKEDRLTLRQNPNLKDYALLDETAKQYDGIYFWLLEEI